MVLLLAVSACSGLSDLAPFPSAKDGTCPPGYLSFHGKCWTVLDQTGSFNFVNHSGKTLDEQSICFEYKVTYPGDVVTEAGTLFSELPVSTAGNVDYSLSYRDDSKDYDFDVPIRADTLTTGNLRTDGSMDFSFKPLQNQPAGSAGAGGSSGTGGSGGQAACSNASTGPCKGLSTECSKCGATGCQAPCYCAAACVCHYCGDSCETQNRKYASDLGTNCSY